MTLQTKFNIDDKVLIYKENKLCSGTIYKVRTEIDKQNALSIIYNIMDKDRECIKGNYGDINFIEESVFATKEDFIKSL